MEAAIPASGIHCWDYATNPIAANWEEPILIMGSYDGNIAFWEPMALVILFVTGLCSALMNFASSTATICWISTRLTALHVHRVLAGSEIVLLPVGI